LDKNNREHNIDFASYFDLAKAAGKEDPGNLQDHELLTPLKENESRYPHSEEINEGGMKYIQSGTDNIIGRKVAIARMRSCNDSDDLELFLREGRITACLEHPNIMPVYDISLDKQGLPFFTMKLIRGENLGKILTRIKSDPVYEEEYRLPVLLEMFIKICDAIAYAHSRGVLHLDLKPDNIEISGFGEVLVCDWGLARLLDEADPELIMKDGVAGPLADINRTINGIVKGTPGFMAPEQADPEKHVKSKQTDIYSLGAILYTILTMEKPVTGDDLKEVIRKTVAGDIIEPRKRSPGRKIPHSLNAVVCKAMSVVPGDRYTSVESLQKEVRSYVEGFATEAEDAPFHRLIVLLFKRHAALTMLCSGALIVLTLVSAAFWQNIEENRIKLEVKNVKIRAEQQRSEEEKKKHELLSVDTAEILVEKAHRLLTDFRYDEALEAVNKSLELKPVFEIALELKCIILVGALRYKDAEETASKMKDYTSQYFTDMASEYGGLLDKSGLLAPEDFLLLVSRIQDDRMLEEEGEYEKFKHRVSTQVEKQLCIETFKRYNLVDRLKMLKELLEVTNPQSGEMDLRLEVFNDKIKLTLIDAPELKRPDVLTGLPIEELNLQNTGITDLSFMRGMPLVKLNISETSVHSLVALAGCPLKELNLKKTPVTDVSPVMRLPLKTLYLGSAKVSPLNFINDMPYLKSLILPVGVYSNKEIESLGKHLEVTFE
jgi:serine/threonine protein kinase